MAQLFLPSFSVEIVAKYPWYKLMVSDFEVHSPVASGAGVSLLTSLVCRTHLVNTMLSLLLNLKAFTK